MRDPGPTPTISLPRDEFIAMIETYLIVGHPIYNYVAKHYKEQILSQLGLGND